LVQARGVVGLEAGVMMLLKLDVCGFFGEVVSSQQSTYINDHQQFVLTAAATLPSEGGGPAQARRPSPVLPPIYWSRRFGRPTNLDTRCQSWTSCLPRSTWTRSSWRNSVDEIVGA
jgi:hypothetical protein